MKHLISLCVVCIPFAVSLAQFTGRYDPDVSVLRTDGTIYPQPWAGGLNFCNFSNVDLNEDGITDLLIFDQSGNRLLGFEGIEEADTFLLKYNRESTSDYPRPSGFVLALDFDNDGDRDLFTHRNIGPVLWQNMSAETGTLSFELYNNGKNFPTEYDGSPGRVGMPGTDVPGIADIDGDGDLDILIFDDPGTFLELHSNQSIELYGHADSLVFIRTDPCWGDFAENAANNTLFLDSCAAMLHDPSAHRNAIHTGSAVCVFDEDNDGDFEALISDISYNRLTFTKNEGTSTDAHIDTVVYEWPLDDIAVSVRTFPAAFLADADGDGNRDILVSPIRRNNAANEDGLLWYRNFGTDVFPEFRKHREAFLQDDMLDFGEGAWPTAVDYDGDGDMDLVVGNYGYFVASGVYSVQLTLLENTDPSGPEFQVKDANYANIPDYISDGPVAPAFGDLDGDNDIDLLLGLSSGSLYLLENVAGPGADPVWTDGGDDYASIDVGSDATPVLADINRDGLIDLVIGERNGNLNYYQNEGSAVAPFFVLQTESFGGLNTSLGIGDVGQSVPTFIDFDGKWHLLVGTSRGTVQHYRNIDGNLAGTFEKFDTAYAFHQEGERSGVTAADFNQDGLPDVVIGNYSGGLMYYRGEAANGIEIPTNAFSVFPNPFDDCISASFPRGQLNIYNPLGQLVWSECLQSAFTGPICPEHLKAGIYFLEFAEISNGDIYSTVIVRQ